MVTCTAAKLHSYVQQLNLLNTGRLSWWRELGCEGSTGLKCSLQTGNEIGASPRVSRTQGRHPATQICVERLCCFLGKRNVATCGNCMIHPTPEGRDLNSLTTLPASGLTHTSHLQGRRICRHPQGPVPRPQQIQSCLSSAAPLLITSLHVCADCCRGSATVAGVWNG